LNGDANDVVRVRRSGDADGNTNERDFTAEGVALELEDWVNGKLETTLPCDVATTIEVSGINTGSDGADGTYTLTAPLRWDGPNGHVIIRNTGDSGDPYEANTRWLLVDADDLFVAIFSDPCDESVLPFDATWFTGTFTNPNAAAAAYSLRKVRNDYTGDAVQIRRESDDVEVNVAFDSNGEVSDSSAISNVTESPDAGDTTATTLGEFLTEEVNLVDADTRNGDFDTDTIWTKQTGVTISGGSANWDGTQTSNTRCFQSIPSISAGCSYRVTYTCTIVSGNIFANVGGNSAGTTRTSSGTYTEIIIGGTADTNFLLVGNPSFVGTVDDVILTALNHDATVVTWYDQSGNGNDATQPTTGNQPLIAGNGALLTDGIDFDGTNDFLETSSAYPTGTNLSAFIVANSTGTNQRVLDTRGTGASGAIAGWQIKFSNSGDVALLDDGTDFIESFDITRSGENLITVIASLTSLSDFTNGSLSDSNTGSITTFDSGNSLYLGANANGQSTQLFDGGISEIIIFNSDQSDNRFKIESNINNYYGIYTPAYDGFVEAWYDQSGNGRHAEQLATGLQPQIVNAGSYLGELDFDGNDDALTFTGPATTAWSLACVCDIEGATGGAQGIFGTGSAADKFELIHATVTNQLILRTLISNDTSVSLAEPTGKILVWSNTSGDGTINLAVDGGALSSNTGHETDFSVTAFSIGKTDNDCLDGQITEVVFYPSDQSANRTAIESNIADEYGITLS
jgi:hypothetical protein